MIGFIDKKGYATKESTVQRFVFKDWAALKPAGRICYVPELRGDIIMGSVAEEEMELAKFSYLATIRMMTRNRRSFLLDLPE
jgi:hypothetical protein